MLLHAAFHLIVFDERNNPRVFQTHSDLRNQPDMNGLVRDRMQNRQDRFASFLHELRDLLYISPSQVNRGSLYGTAI